MAGLAYFDAVRGVTWDDWRLPRVRPINGVAFDYTTANDGSTDTGNNLSAPGSAYSGSTASELVYMYYSNLGNLGYYDLAGNFEPNHGLVNTGPLLNLNSRGYWSGTEYVPDAATYAFFLAGYGTQTIVGKGDEFTPWAVRDGDVAAQIPLPAAVWLFGSALAGLLAARGAGGAGEGRNGATVELVTAPHRAGERRKTYPCPPPSPELPTDSRQQVPPPPIPLDAARRLP